MTHIVTSYFDTSEYSLSSGAFTHRQLGGKIHHFVRKLFGPTADASITDVPKIPLIALMQKLGGVPWIEAISGYNVGMSASGSLRASEENIVNIYSRNELNRQYINNIQQSGIINKFLFAKGQSYEYALRQWNDQLHMNPLVEGFEFKFTENLYGFLSNAWAIKPLENENEYQIFTTDPDSKSLRLFAFGEIRARQIYLLMLRINEESRGAVRQGLDILEDQSEQRRRGFIQFFDPWLALAAAAARRRGVLPESGKSLLIKELPTHTIPREQREPERGSS